jgi:hypothetical protein
MSVVKESNNCCQVMNHEKERSFVYDGLRFRNPLGIVALVHCMRLPGNGFSIDTRYHSSVPWTRD